MTGIQLLDGIGAGIFGVASSLMIADLSKGTGRFNLLKGVIYSAKGIGGSVSSIVAGIIVKQYGYPIGFASLAAIGILGTLFFIFLVPKSKNVTTVLEKGRLRPAI